MELESVLLVGKVIGRVKKRVYDISLLSHVNDEYLNETSLFDMRWFAVDKETYLSTIYNSSHPCPDSIRKYSSLDENDQGVSYGLDDAINNDSEYEDMGKQSHHLNLKRSMMMNKTRQKVEKIRVIKSPTI